MRRRGGLGRRGDLQEDPRGLPGPARAGGARALRLLRPAPRWANGGIRGRARVHAARFLLMLGLSVLYVEAGLNERFEEVFYGVQAAVGALVAMAIVRLGRKFINDVPLALIAIASFGVDARNRR